jgi:hypothetical protein
VSPGKRSIAELRYSPHGQSYRSLHRYKRTFGDVTKSYENAVRYTPLPNRTRAGITQPIPVFLIESLNDGASSALGSLKPIPIAILTINDGFGIVVARCRIYPGRNDG